MEVNTPRNGKKMPFDKHLRMLLCGDGLAAFGGWIDFIAILTIPVYRLAADTYDIALIGAATLLPGIVLSKVIGKLVGGPKSIQWLRLSLLLRAIFTWALLVAHNLPAFITIAMIRAVFNSLAIPAISVISAQSVPEKERTRYYSILNMINSAAKITGPALGAAIGALLGDPYTLTLSGLSTLLAFAVFCTIRPQNLEPRTTANKSSTTPLPSLDLSVWRTYAGSILIYFAAVFMVNNQLPLILSANHLDKAALGFLVSASACGNFVYGAWSARRSASRPLKGSFNEILVPGLGAMSLFVVIGSYFGLASILRVEPLVGLFFVMGSFSARFAISSNVFMVTNFREHLGYASGRVQAVQNAAMLFAPFAGAVVLERLSAGVLFLVAGASGLIGLLAIRFSASHQ